LWHLLHVSALAGLLVPSSGYARASYITFAKTSKIRKNQNCSETFVFF